MARQTPNSRKKERISFEEVSGKVGDIINTGVGKAVGGIAEKNILGGRPGTGKVKFSETPEGKKRAYRMSHKGLAANREY